MSFNIIDNTIRFIKKRSMQISESESRFIVQFYLKKVISRYQLSMNCIKYIVILRTYILKPIIEYLIIPESE